MVAEEKRARYTQKKMGGLMVIELCHLRTHFCAYEEFISCFFNVFLIDKVLNSLWNGTQRPYI